MISIASPMFLGEYEPSTKSLFSSRQNYSINDEAIHYKQLPKNFDFIHE